MDCVLRILIKRKKVFFDMKSYPSTADEKFKGLRVCFSGNQHVLFSLNIFILHRLRNKFLQLILISLDSASWELHQYSRRMFGDPLPGLELGTS